MSRRQLPKDEAPVESVPIHVKYRPSSLKDIVGQKPTVDSLTKLFKDPSAPHAYLFTGPSGVGKTTLARIVGAHLGVTAENVMEIDAATNNGVDDMRDITRVLHYKGFGETPNKLIIIDECHQLSKQAWNSLLKSVEEPPAHLFFAFCTTEPGKVIETIRTRCNCYNLQPVRHDDLMDLLEWVADEEKYDVDDKVLSKVARAAAGSPRMALTMLAKVQGVSDPETVALLLESPDENADVIELARDLVKGSLTWDRLTAKLKALPDTPPESVRLVIVNYLSSVLLGSKDGKQVPLLLDMLACFSRGPLNPSEKWAPLLLAFGTYIYP